MRNFVFLIFTNYYQGLASMGEKRSTYKILTGKLEGENSLEDQEVDGTLKK
jgi:hypothetical protein